MAVEEHHCREGLTRYGSEEWEVRDRGLWCARLEEGGAGHLAGPGRMSDSSVFCTSDERCPGDSHPAAWGPSAVGDGTWGAEERSGHRRGFEYHCVMGGGPCTEGLAVNCFSQEQG